MSRIAPEDMALLILVGMVLVYLLIGRYMELKAKNAKRKPETPDA